LKLGFFTKLYDAITDFRLYPYVVQKEKLVHAFLYFCSFMFLVSVILTTTGMIKITNWFNEFLIDYHEQINNFEVKDGELRVDNNMDFDYLNVKIYTDDNRNIEDVDFKLLDLENSKVSILAFKNAIAIGSERYGYVSTNYQESNISINKEGLYDAITSVLKNPVFRIYFYSVLLIGIFIAFIVTRMIYVFFISLILVLLGLLFRVNYKYKDYMKVAFYIITFPTITEVIALICVGELNDYAVITYYLLCYVYMFYAVRALKLDNILTMTQEKIMNIKNESEKANSILHQEKDNKGNESNNKDSETKKGNNESEESKINEESHSQEDDKTEKKEGKDDGD